MAIEYTTEQQQVIDLRNRNLLVSAAAGSGKTAVLVERIISRLTRDKDPINVDELLIVTFTEAAAAEMKERIHAAIEKALKKDPGNYHLQRQATLIHQAQINTIDKFCLNVMKDYFYVIDLEPGYRVMEKGETLLLEQDTVKEVLEQAYVKAEPDFVDFVECFAAGKDDLALDKLIIKLANFAKQYPEPEVWLDECAEKYDTDKYNYFDECVTETMRYLEGIKGLVEVTLDICDEADGPAGYKKGITSDLELIERLLGCRSYSNLQSEMNTYKWNPIGRKSSKDNPDKIDQVNAIRKYYKGIVDGLKGKYFFENETTLKVDMLAAKKHVLVILDLVKSYMKEFAKAKRQKNLIDFIDMEHFALQILTKKEGDRLVPSEIAESYQQRFAEVMIDEYQDSNFVQEALLSSVSKVSKGIYNRFMVGDVKQSIYRFRLSRPELFMSKHNSYSLSDSLEQRIDLHKNFRSRREVLDSCNFVFEQVMTAAFGGIEYDDQAALYVGADYKEQKGNETEFLVLECPDYNAQDQLELEAEMIATRISELMETQLVVDKATGEFRKLRYKDITILGRSATKYAEAMTKVFLQKDIPLYTGPKKGYFETPEVKLILSFLKALDNPMQDIHYTAVMTSIFGGFTSDDLAIIRSGRIGKSMYESTCTYAEEGTDNELRKRLKLFLLKFNQFRDRVAYMAIHEFLWVLLDETGYLDYESVKPGGSQRRANLEMLVEKAIAFEGTSYKGLFNFVRYVEQLETFGDDSGEAVVLDENMDAVTLMTIHGSKGLEYPVVFVIGTGRRFNTMDANSSVVTHPSYGVGINVIDSKLRTKSPTLLKKIMQQKETDETVAEEMRILYVAMTRAKEKLILTGTTTSLKAQEDLLVVLKNHYRRSLPYYMIAKSRKYMDWILAALYRECEHKPIKLVKVTAEELIYAEAEKMLHGRVKKKILSDWDTDKVYNDAVRAQLEEQFSYEYPHGEANGIKQKLSVSELKKRVMEEEEGQELFKEQEIIPLLPEFMQEKEELTGASRGTAYHKLMELLDYSLEYDEELLRKVIEEKQKAGYLDEQMVQCIDVQDILKFLHSSAGKRMQSASRKNNCFAEQPFVLGLDANKVYPDVDSDEIVLIQGIIDVYFEEDGELVVLDYKTDNVTRAQELADKYHAQLEYYAEALKHLTGKPVKEKIIYSFKLHEVIEV